MKLRFGDEKGIFWLPAPPKERPARAEGGARPRSGPRVVVRGPKPESDWTPPAEFPRLSGLVGLDFETRDPLLKKKGPGWCFRSALGDDAGYVVGVGLAWGTGESRGKGYWPLRHEGGGNVDPGVVMRFLRDVVTDSNVQLVCHNAPYDLGWLWEQGIKPTNLPYDTQVATALLDEHRQINGKRYSLDSVAKDFLGRSKNETLLRAAASHYGVDPKSGLWRLPAQFVGPYGESDAEDTLDLWLHLEPMLRRQHLLPVLALEARVTQVLLAMRARGRRIDMDRAAQLQVKYQATLTEAQQRLRTLAGFPLNPNSPKDLERLFTARGLPFKRTKTGQGQFDKAFRAQYPDDEAVHWLTINQRYGKALGTYVNGYLLDMPVKGRLHGTYNQTASDEGGTVSGRLSSSLPNEQNWPARDGVVGKDIGQCALPEEGELWMTNDFSAQEPRLAAHLAIAVEATGYQEIRDAYAANPRLDTHQWVADLIHRSRFDGKTMNLAVMYGRGEASLCRELGLPTEVVGTGRDRREYAGPEGKAIIDQYHARFPFMRETAEMVKRKAKREGYIRTLLGRRCHFGEGAAPEFTAFNRWVQGSAADQAKKAMADAYDEGYVPLVLVHDAIDASVPSREAGARLTEIMETCVTLTVPFKVDAGYGDSWYAAKAA